MGELDFSDFYYQMQLKNESSADKKKLGYLCIRTGFGTMTFARALMGLLGMDVYQDKLTDRLFGDLVQAGKLVKIADNIHFSGETIPDFHNTQTTSTRSNPLTPLTHQANNVFMASLDHSDNDAHHILEHAFRSLY